MAGDLLAGQLTSGLSFGTQRPALSYQYSMVIVVMCTAFVPCYIQPRWSKIVVEIVALIMLNFFSGLLTKMVFEVLYGRSTDSNFFSHETTQMSSSGTRHTDTGITLAPVILTLSTRSPSLLIAPLLSLPRLIILYGCGTQWSIAQDELIQFSSAQSTTDILACSSRPWIA